LFQQRRWFLVSDAVPIYPTRWPCSTKSFTNITRNSCRIRSQTSSGPKATKSPNWTSMTPITDGITLYSPLYYYVQIISANVIQSQTKLCEKKKKCAHVWTNESFLTLWTAENQIVFFFFPTTKLFCRPDTFTLLGCDYFSVGARTARHASALPAPQILLFYISAGVGLDNLDINLYTYLRPRLLRYYDY
jgi:hypothetical protein